jgi:hypothetical protein
VPTVPGGAAPVIKYKCAGSIQYHGHPFEYFPGVILWSWDFDSHGTCVGGVLKQLTYTVHGNTMPSCGGPRATQSRREPTSVYLTTTSVTNPKNGSTTVFRQQWVGFKPLQINHYSPVPSRYIPIGGIVGFGVINYGKPTGTYNATTLKGKVAFTFSGEEIPGTDQPDGEAC